MLAALFAGTDRIHPVTYHEKGLKRDHGLVILKIVPNEQQNPILRPFSSPLLK